MNVAYDLDRYVGAQSCCYDAVLAELKNGRKATDWMGCIFPHLEGLDHADLTAFYTIQDRSEAAAYLAHPVLGKRLIECTKLAIHQAMSGAGALFEPMDEAAFHASISLFSRVKGASPVFESALYAFYGGTADPRTLKALRLAFVAELDED